MVVFQYEWKRSKKSILIWAIVLAVCIFFMTPVYYGLIGMTDSLPENFAQGGFFETVGVSLDLLMKPLGMYSFLTGFFMIAGGIFGMHFGLSLHTKECTENTSEYLFTKPCGRRMIYLGKTQCLLGGVCVVGGAYLVASLVTMLLFKPGFSLGEFFLLAISFFLVTLFFGALGLLLGSCKPNNRSPLLTAGLIVFLEYCITAFSRTVSNRMIGFLSPFSFFSSSEIHKLRFYEWDYLIWYIFLVAAFLILSHAVLMKRDIKFVA